MTISILSAKEFSMRLKVTIQSTGRLGFSEETAVALNLSEQSWVKFAQDSDNGAIYLIMSNENEDAFKVCKAGDYFYLPTRHLFLSLGINFQEKSIMFDLSRKSELDKELDGTVYKMNQRENEKKRKIMR